MNTYLGRGSKRIPLHMVNRKHIYPAYKDTKGSYGFGSYMLSIDHVQGDPFASPSKAGLGTLP